VKVLLVHGVGLENPDPNWLKPWQDAIAAGLKQYGFAGEPDFAPPVKLKSTNPILYALTATVL